MARAQRRLLATEDKIWTADRLDDVIHPLQNH
jgi:hypothetical protein